jgi:heme/copper-type cytochrome/quinol oxidase subunit 2
MKDESGLNEPLADFILACAFGSSFILPDSSFMRIFYSSFVVFHSSFLHDWWLPTNYSVHGQATDALFVWFFWITMAVFIGVELVLILFVLKYRARGPAAKAHYIHGNNRIELLWTIVPAITLIALALASRRVWNDFRDSPAMDDPARSKILIIGQQFKWNVIYPGPDGKFGRYLQYPKPTDLTWPVGSDGQLTKFAGVMGPSQLPLQQAVSAINSYIDSENPLGKDFSDPDGKDDDWSPEPGRPIFVPVNRPVEVQVESKDVIHDLFLPNFRVQLYAVPGMTGRFVFTPTTTTAELESASRETISLDELKTRLASHTNGDLTIDIDEHTPGALHDKTGWRYVDSPKKKKPATIIRNGMEFAAGVVEKLKTAGISSVTVHKPQPFEVACAQLCGAQHYLMRGELIVLSQEEFDKRFPSSPHGN